MISKNLQILGLQPRNFKSFSQSLEQFFLTVGQNKITFQVTEENEADQTALEENYPSIGDPKEIGQAHDMFSRIFRLRIFSTKYYVIFSNAQN